MHSSGAALEPRFQRALLSHPLTGVPILRLEWQQQCVSSVIRGAQHSNRGGFSAGNGVGGHKLMHGSVSHALLYRLNLSSEQQVSLHNLVHIVCNAALLSRTHRHTQSSASASGQQERQVKQERKQRERERVSSLL
jgi:hypothetical protein